MIGDDSGLLLQLNQALNQKSNLKQAYQCHSKDTLPKLTSIGYSVGSSIFVVNCRLTIFLITEIKRKNSSRQFDGNAFIRYGSYPLGDSYASCQRYNEQECSHN
jgi:hypothetical protein